MFLTAPTHGKGPGRNQAPVKYKGRPAGDDVGQADRPLILRFCRSHGHCRFLLSFMARRYGGRRFLRASSLQSLQKSARTSRPIRRIHRQASQQNVPGGRR